MRVRVRRRVRVSEIVRVRGSDEVFTFRVRVRVWNDLCLVFLLGGGDAR